MTMPTTDIGTDMITDYLRHLADLGRAQNTRDHYGELLHRMNRELPAGLPAAHTDELRDWIYVEGRKNITREHYRAITHGFFEWATHPNDPRIDFNPAALLPHVKVPSRRPRPIPTEQLHSILRAAQEPYRRWYLIAAYAGLRCIELAGLHRSHVTETEIWIRGKGERDRVVPTHPLIWAEVRNLAGPLTLRADGRPAARRYVSARGNFHLQHVLGLPDVTMHRLRHWFGTAAYASSGRDIRVAQTLLGHAQVTTTQGYVGMSVNGLEQAIAALPVAS